ncbi:hypothetical protein BEWA_013290 [Theileria equi strain WA]|uniref:Uncharacterized protein n=1 Tax=Theileria equi strain WA TaxID=1537102 RepID=L1LC07_THEEQ|nr:hypothetical protein BEWA_013290 [Theileria equi strain WA]EKX72770.1 hypothetical protein BEWA_013290 [Theileria equi strain WA]|eukprot:XP_004832222.1 hypothetical protein BEWA_013290 [Theileria equi strain WA]
MEQENMEAPTAMETRFEEPQDVEKEPKVNKMLTLGTRTLSMGKDPTWGMRGLIKFIGVMIGLSTSMNLNFVFLLALMAPILIKMDAFLHIFVFIFFFFMLIPVVILLFYTPMITWLTSLGLILQGSTYLLLLLVTYTASESTGKALYFAVGGFLGFFSGLTLITSNCLVSCSPLEHHTYINFGSSLGGCLPLLFVFLFKSLLNVRRIPIETYDEILLTYATVASIVGAFSILSGILSIIYLRLQYIKDHFKTLVDTFNPKVTFGAALEVAKKHWAVSIMVVLNVLVRYLVYPSIIPNLVTASVETKLYMIAIMPLIDTVTRLSVIVINARFMAERVRSFFWLTVVNILPIVYFFFSPKYKKHTFLFNPGYNVGILVFFALLNTHVVILGRKLFLEGEKKETAIEDCKAQISAFGVISALECSAAAGGALLSSIIVGYLY